MKRTTNKRTAPGNEKYESLSLLADQLPAVVWSTDKKLRFTGSMGAGLKQLGLVSGQMVGTSLYKYFRTTDPNFLPIRRHREALSGTRSTYEFEWEGRVFHSLVSPLIGRNGAIIGTAGLALDITDRKRAEEALTGSLARMRGLAGWLQSAREEERRLIAMEIHDRLGQALTGLKLDLSSLTNDPCSATGNRRRLRRAFRSLDDAIQTVREISTGLRPAVLDSLGLKAAIEWQAGEFQSRTGVLCRLSLPSREVPLSPDKSTAVFRVFQELLTNIARHARARRVKASLAFNHDHLSLIVRDNGRGISDKDISNPASFGLIGMRERASAFGGSIDIQGRRNRGTTVTLILPLC